MIKRQAPTVPFVVFFGVAALAMSALRFQFHQVGLGLAFLALAVVLFLYAWYASRKKP
jgi:hypothetical protein